MDILSTSRQGWVEVICALPQESHTISDVMTIYCACGWRMGRGVVLDSWPHPLLGKTPKRKHMYSWPLNIPLTCGI